MTDDIIQEADVPYEEEEPTEDIDILEELEEEIESDEFDKDEMVPTDG